MHAITAKRRDREEKNSQMEAESMLPVCWRGKLSAEMMEGPKEERNAGIGPEAETTSLPLLQDNKRPSSGSSHPRRMLWRRKRLHNKLNGSSAI